MGRNSEKNYIAKRKRKAFFESLIFYFFWLFPVKKNKIVVWTGEGNGGFCDSPKYIIQELHRQNLDYSVVWLTNHPEKDFPDYVRTEPYSLIKRAYHLSTANWWISNTRSVYGTKKRKKTKYIMTWHAIAGIKPIGKQRGSKLPKMAEIVSKYDSSMIDYIPYGNEWFYNIREDGLFYYGEMIPTGAPRCDVIINQQEEMHDKYRKLFNLEPDCKIVMYAPTFRGGSQKSTRSVKENTFSLDVVGLIQSLEKRFGGKWYVFLRLHPQVAEYIGKMNLSEESDCIIDVSQLPDISELLAASDVYITDYSAPIFDFALSKKPAFIYADDYEEYVNDRGDLLFSLDELPFSVASDNTKLISEILGFDEEAYRCDLEKFLEELGFFEKGNSSMNVVKYLDETENN